MFQYFWKNASKCQRKDMTCQHFVLNQENLLKDRNMFQVQFIDHVSVMFKRTIFKYIVKKLIVKWKPLTHVLLIQYNLWGKI